MEATTKNQSDTRRENKRDGGKFDLVGPLKMSEVATVSITLPPAKLGLRNTHTTSYTSSPHCTAVPAAAESHIPGMR